ncbi:sorting nexin-31-like [Hemiscyllium ocellatum]|uniref:sorting nexin-31-like n=1 Tax=Hemiscyllium ocellatum TaxID=170820 RepID=UPI002966F6A3|nr:sorting nexin-31-like [Hemiscyllium ocellatum]
MQFTIAQTEKGNDSLGVCYMIYDIYLEGFLFCKLRYSQLHRWNEKLRRYFGSNLVPHFPPKSYLAQTESTAEERRLQLQQYLQKVGEDPVISVSEIFTTLLKNAQQETFKICARAILLEILLADGKKLLIDTHTTHSAERMLEIVAQKVELSRQFLEHFALYLVRELPNQGYSVLKRLNAFELSYVSLWSLQDENCKIMIRKSYLDPLENKILMQSNVGVSLLYSQATYELERGWVSPTEEQYQQLKAFQNAEMKREFLETIEEVKFYGYVLFEACTCDYPEPNSPSIVRVGKDEINCCIQLPSNHIKEVSFKVNRIRCWKISLQITEETELKQKLSFEYQDSQDFRQWITIYTYQAFLLSRCIQEIVKEKLKIHAGYTEMQIENAKSNCRTTPWNPLTALSKYPGAVQQKKLLKT